MLGFDGVEFGLDSRLRKGAGRGSLEDRTKGPDDSELEWWVPHDGWATGMWFTSNCHLYICMLKQFPPFPKPFSSEANDLSRERHYEPQVGLDTSGRKQIRCGRLPVDHCQHLSSLLWTAQRTFAPLILTSRILSIIMLWGLQVMRPRRRSAGRRIALLSDEHFETEFPSLFLYK